MYSIAFIPDMLVPYAVEDLATREDPDVDVWENNVVEVSHLLVLEEKVRHPYLVSLRQGEVLDLPCTMDG